VRPEAGEEGGRAGLSGAPSRRARGPLPADVPAAASRLHHQQRAAPPHGRVLPRQRPLQRAADLHLVSARRPGPRSPALGTAEPHRGACPASAPCPRPGCGARPLGLLRGELSWGRLWALLPSSGKTQTGFDTVPRSILLDKLAAHGLDGCPLR